MTMGRQLLLACLCLQAGVSQSTAPGRVLGARRCTRHARAACSGGPGHSRRAAAEEPQQARAPRDR